MKRRFSFFDRDGKFIASIVLDANDFPMSTGSDLSMCAYALGLTRAQRRITHSYTVKELS